MTLQQADDALWTEWKRSHERQGLDSSLLCRDGAIDVDSYSAQTTRLLVVMRESNDWAGGDIRLQLAEAPTRQMWKNIANWASGLLLGFPPFEAVSRPDRQKATLGRIAAINVKKATGTGSTDFGALNQHASLDRDLLRQQILLLRPTLLLACGTFDQLAWLIDIWPRSDGRLKAHLAGLEETRLLSFRHPAQIPYQRSYRMLEHAFVASNA